MRWGVSDPSGVAYASGVVKWRLDVALRTWFVVKQEKERGARESKREVKKFEEKDDDSANWN